MSEYITTVFDTQTERSFRIQRRDGTIEEFLSQAHLDSYGDIETAREGLGWVDAEGNLTPIQTDQPGKAGHSYHVVHEGRRTFVSSHPTKEAADKSASAANAKARDGGIDRDPYVVVDVAPTPEVN